MRKLLEFGKEVIIKDECNAQAANVIAVVFAELRFYFITAFYFIRHFKEAREIFNQLMETNPNNLNNLINMAHLEFLQQNYENAIKIYSNYL